ncbi:MAG: hypothetical protein WD058_03085 [Dehalococcoidia bacterium]
MGERTRERVLDAAKESVAIAVVGDGIVAAAFGGRHAMLWTFGPGPWRRFTRFFAERDWTIRSVAIAQTVLGMWWIWRITRRAPR